LRKVSQTDSSPREEGPAILQNFRLEALPCLPNIPYFNTFVIILCVRRLFAPCSTSRTVHVHVIRDMLSMGLPQYFIQYK